jgi:hypothetical protein
MRACLPRSALLGLCLGLGMVAGLLAPAPVLAAENLRLSGFGTLGVVYNDEDDVDFVRDLTQPRGADKGFSGRPDSMLGGQISYRIRPQLDAVGQALVRYSFKDDYRPQLTWAYLRYAPSPEHELRLGRVSWDVFMFSDARNVGYSHLWARPPIEYFGLQPLSHIDGADWVYRRPLGPGLFWAGLYAGRADEEIPVAGGPNYELAGMPVGGGHVNFQTRHWWFRASASMGQFKNESERLKPLLQALRAGGNPLAGRLQLEDARIRLLSLGAVLDQGPLQGQMMLTRSITDTLTLPSYHSGYALLGYRLGSWTPYASFAAIQSGPAPVTGVPQANALLRTVQTNQRTAAVGLRYELLNNVALKFQAERLKAEDPVANRLVRDPQPGWDGRVVLFSTMLDFVF